MVTSKIINLERSDNRISGLIVDRALYVHKQLGPGLLESAYEEALVYFLKKEGLNVKSQKSIPVRIQDCFISAGFRADLVVENSVICEIKSIEKLAPVHEAQLMTYLRLSGIKVGLLINFGALLLKDGLKRMVI